jgi:two-component system, chemotaxis family, protein-glutamate methylesterase/glutaminase
MELTTAPPRQPGLVVLGTSWGGLEAVSRLLGRMPRPPGTALALVQHRGPQASALARLLARRVAWPVAEVDDKERIVAGRLYIGPPGYHLLVEHPWGEREAPTRFALSTDEPVRFSRPSIDVLFESAADAYGDRLIGVLLTGANDDGARGLAHIQTRGGFTIVQDPESASRPDMPRAALARMAPDVVAPLDDIADLLVDVCRGPAAGQDRGMEQGR